jgi:hypothetical protein
VGLFARLLRKELVQVLKAPFFFQAFLDQVEEHPSGRAAAAAVFDHQPPLLLYPQGLFKQLVGEFQATLVGNMEYLFSGQVLFSKFVGNLFGSSLFRCSHQCLRSCLSLSLVPIEEGEMVLLRSRADARAKRSTQVPASLWYHMFGWL